MNTDNELFAVTTPIPDKFQPGDFAYFRKYTYQNYHRVVILEKLDFDTYQVEAYKFESPTLGTLSRTVADIKSADELTIYQRIQARRASRNVFDRTRRVYRDINRSANILIQLYSAREHDTPWTNPDSIRFMSEIHRELDSDILRIQTFSSYGTAFAYNDGTQKLFQFENGEVKYVESVDNALDYYSCNFEWNGYRYVEINEPYDEDDGNSYNNEYRLGIYGYHNGKKDWESRYEIAPYCIGFENELYIGDEYRYRTLCKDVRRIPGYERENPLCLERDGSISGVETITGPYPLSGIKQLAIDLIECARDSDAKCPNDGYGLHISICTSTWTHAHKARFAAFFHENQDVIELLARRGTNSYLDYSKGMRTISGHKANKHYRHYDAVNFNDNRAEVRCFRAAATTELWLLGPIELVHCAAKYCAVCSNSLEPNGHGPLDLAKFWQYARINRDIYPNLFNHAKQCKVETYLPAKDETDPNRPKTERQKPKAKATGSRYVYGVTPVGNATLAWSPRTNVQGIEVTNAYLYPSDGTPGYRKAEYIPSMCIYHVNGIFYDNWGEQMALDKIRKIFVTYRETLRPMFPEIC